MLQPIRRRSFDDCEAVVLRTAQDVVLDRDKLPKRKANGQPYELGCTRRRWIVYTDNPASRFFGEWSTYSTRGDVIHVLRQRGADLACELKPSDFGTAEVM